ncbi:MAG TPA: hypothetical protein VHD36_23065 [Pirellulales bacterium]|nr:hypothetical protein [Pirellulales bacterium]
MRIPLIASLGLALLAPALGEAQNADVRPTPAPTPAKVTTADHEFSFGQMTPTPEMWLYQQALRRYSDPRAAVRRRAEFEADQRQARLAAQRWFGYSIARPTVSPTPISGTYSPMWTSNSPFSTDWCGVNPVTIVAPVTPVRSSTGYGLW